MATNTIRLPAKPGAKPLGGTLVTETVFFFLATLIHWAVAYILQSGFTAFSSMALYIWMVVILFRVDQASTAIVLPFVLNRLSVMVSFLFIENGTYIPELGRHGEAGDRSASFVFYCAVMFFSLVLFVRLLSKGPKIDNSRLRAFYTRYGNTLGIVAVAFCACITLYVLAQGVTLGFPLLTGTDRFVFRRFTAAQLLSDILNNKFIFAAMLGLVFFGPSSKPVRNTALALFVAQCAIFFLFNEKFFTIVSNVSIFIAPWLAYTKKRIGAIVAPLVPLATVVLVAIFSVTYFIYADFGKRSPYETMERLGGRVAAQGELWWVAKYEDVGVFEWDERLVAKHIESLKVDRPDQYTFAEHLATYYFALKYSPNNIVNSLLRNAGTVTYTMGWEPLGLVMFGYGGLIPFMMLTGFVLALSAGYLRWAMESLSPFSIFLATYLLTQLLYMTNQGTPFLVFNIGKIKFAMLFISLEMIQLVIANGKNQVMSTSRRMGMQS